MNNERSKELFNKAKRLMPGGVSSPVRAFEPHPFFTASAKGSRLVDVDGNEFIDYCMAYGPLIFGHAPDLILEKVRAQLSHGTLYGTPTAGEVELAELITRAVPSVEMLRLVSTGLEATMHAVRAARGFTRRNKIIKFEGCYHGAYDYVLVKAGSGATTFGSPTSDGIPQESTKNTVVVPYNDPRAVQEAVDANKDQVAAILVEPVIGNAGPILPKDGYLESLRKIADGNNVLLIFDEVITGFRLAFGGAQERYGVGADLTTLGKILGGGLPLAAFGGRRDVMEHISPSGKVYQAGTFSGNPLSVTASIAVITALKERREQVYSQLDRNGGMIRKGLTDIVRDAKIKAQVNGITSMFQIFFTETPVIDYSSAQTADRQKFSRFHRELLKRKVFFPPSQFETCFLSTAHSQEDIDQTLQAASEALRLVS